MGYGTSAEPGGLFLLLLLFLLVVAILWILLPFAVFGIKDRLNRMAKQNALTYDHLAEITAELRRQTEQQEHAVTDDHLAEIAAELRRQTEQLKALVLQQKVLIQKMSKTASPGPAERPPAGPPKGK